MINMTFTNRFFKLTGMFATAAILAGCITTSSKYEMDDATREHPATQRFLHYIKAVESSDSFESLVEEYYLPATQRRIASAVGWGQLVYSAPYKVLKDGNCSSITLKPAVNRSQLDCVGSMLVRSMFIGDHEEPVHLRVFLVNLKGQWYLDKAGYVHTNSSSGPVTYGRGGIKFKSALEP